MRAVFQRPDTDNSAVPCRRVSAMRHLLPWHRHTELRVNQYWSQRYRRIASVPQCILRRCVAKWEHMAVTGSRGKKKKKDSAYKMKFVILTGFDTKFTVFNLKKLSHSHCRRHTHMPWCPEQCVMVWCNKGGTSTQSQDTPVILYDFEESYGRL